MLHAGTYQEHFAPAAGDERLLISVFQGQPIAVLYRPVVPGNTTSARLMGATIDQIVKLTNAQIAVGRNGDSYTIEAAIPLAELNLDNTADILRGDVGVIYADETGANRALRLYYTNHDTAMTADLTTEATLQPGNWGEIELARGPNLLQNGDFEAPLADNVEAGWTVATTRNGATASISADVARAGAHSLLLQQSAPVKYAPEAYGLADYGAFINSANAGTGGGYVAVEQRVPVVAGKKIFAALSSAHAGFSGRRKEKSGAKSRLRFVAMLAALGRRRGRRVGVEPSGHDAAMEKFDRCALQLLWRAGSLHRAAGRDFGSHSIWPQHQLRR